MRRFFTKEQTKALTKGSTGVGNCYKCGLYAKCKSPKMDPQGGFKKGIMIIGEYPSVEDDRAGRPWQGPDGQYLEDTLGSLGVDLHEDCLSLFAVNCRPNKRNPTPKEIDHCRSVKVFKAIERYKPYVIILLGPIALKSFLSHRWVESLGSIDRWRGWQIPDKEYKTWVCPTYSPQHIQKMENKGAAVIWKNDLKKAIDCLEQSLPRYKKIRFRKLKSLKPLKEIEKGTVVIDIETTGLKPQAKYHKIVCCAIAYNENEVFVFPMPKTKKQLQPLIDLLQNNMIRKVAANMKYEDSWFNEKLGTKVVGWDWDTMLAAKVMDNRTHIAGLKFQAYVQFGVLDYSSEIKPYFKSENANAMNLITKLIERPGGMKDLLKYCGLDAIYEYRLFNKQQTMMNYDWLPF